MCKTLSITRLVINGALALVETGETLSADGDCHIVRNIVAMKKLAGCGGTHINPVKVSVWEAEGSA